ncbi:MAG: triose-phosphate isomerase [Candidatus Aenigmarchaeota archaeon]|nr:triose-phosphate isomerase [Candidatus Aenigmarchaeota archaeon]
MLYLINFKTYFKGTGLNAVRLASIMADVSEENNVEMAAAVQPTDIDRVSKLVSVVSQHIDPIPYGAHTGQILPQAVRDAGAVGTLINHSERRIPLKEIENCVSVAKSCGLKTIVCVSDIKEAMEVSKLLPDSIAFEDPDLIGSGRSISKTKPDLVSRFVELLEELSPSVMPLCGAGISTREDVVKAKELGTRGVLVASSVVNAESPKEALLNLIL